MTYHRSSKMIDGLVSKVSKTAFSVLLSGFVNCLLQNHYF